MKLETLAVHAGRAVEPDSQAITPSITLSTTFVRAEDGSYPAGYVYGRSGNPTRGRWEEAMAQLEGGAAAFAFASGQAAAAAIFQLLKTGDHLILPDDLYHGVRYLTQDVLARWGLHSTFVDMGNLTQLAQAIRPQTRLIWVETPSNPLLKVADIAAIAQMAHEVGAMCAVDNTWATPIWQRPLTLGADLVMHSTTKYLGGHSDLLGGCVVVRDAAAAEPLATIQKLSGAVPSPFDCWLLLRSLPTLPYRVQAQTAAAQAIAAFLQQHPQVEWVHYPGLPDHPGHEVAVRQMAGFGGMLSFQVRGGEAEAMAAAAKLKLISRATSLGGVESLIEHRASVEGPATTTPPNLLRFSVGLEHQDDLLEDLAQALPS